MCAISFVMDYGRNTFPIDSWDKPRWDQFQRLMDEAKKLDEITGTPDCVDPEKAQYVEMVEDFLARVPR